MFEAIKWPADLTPSRSPIYFTNELEVATSPETIWSLLVNPKAWPRFYPGVQQVTLMDGHQTLHAGTRFETNLAGQDVQASVQEWEPITRIAWGGGTKSSRESRAYHAWIITPTRNGCHLWMEETMQGPLWLELAKAAPDIFWLTHEKLLANLSKIAAEHRAALARALGMRQPLARRAARRRGSWVVGSEGSPPQFGYTNYWQISGTVFLDVHTDAFEAFQPMYATLP